VDLPHAEAFDHLARLHRMQWPDGVSNFVRPEAWAFHQSMALEWLESGRAMLSFLMAGDRVVAATYGLVERGRFSLFQQGWDSNFKHLSIGNLAVHWSLETAAARGIHTYDTLTGDCRYKAEWCPQLSHTLDFETFHPEVLRGHAFRALRHLRRAITRCFFPPPGPGSILRGDGVSGTRRCSTIIHQAERGLEKELPRELNPVFHGG
jgi:CelD/BcsL family acetyltransferase involved in cellulose biosynthesis